MMMKILLNQKMLKILINKRKKKLQMKKRMTMKKISILSSGRTSAKT